VQIKEFELARFLRIRPIVLTDQFIKLDKDGILTYTPPKDSPQLTYTQERIAPSNLKFNKERYSFLKERHAFRMEKILFYAEALQCRNQLLLDYFDEKDASVCGQCDVCQNRHESYSTNSTFYTIRMKVEYFLRQEATSIHDLVPKFKTFEEKKVLKAVSHLIDNGVVGRHDNGLLTWEG
jgi:ATP-dependent DNA helicase RecQ